ncbi:hypothetical protein JCM10213_001892 [Rhodosporidiobolus nylandii]
MPSLSRAFAALTASLLGLSSAPTASAQATSTANWEGVGTWSSGNGAVLTGPNFGVPYNNSFNYPSVAGYSFSFTDDGYFEQAQFTWNSNATDHHCIEAVITWAHGTYELLSNGSIMTDLSVFASDNRVQVQNACSPLSSAVYYLDSEKGLYKTWAVSQWRGKEMLRLGSFDGTLLPRMYKMSNTPRDYMFPSYGITNTSSGTFTIGGSR